MSLWGTIVAAISTIATSLIRAWQSFRRGKETGRAEVRQETADNVVVINKAAKEVKNEVDALGDDDLKRRAGRWVRGRKPGKPPTGK